MHTLKTIGIAGATVAFLLTSTVAFAESPANTSARAPKAQSGDDRMMGERATMASSTMRDKALEHLDAIQDKMKQEMAKRLVTQFDNLNKGWTDHFTQELDRYDALLVKIQDRATTAASNGKDISSTTAAIQAAKNAITAARTAVAAQIAKTYTPDTATTTATSTPAGQEKFMQTLRKSFKTVQNALFKDLFALRDGPMKDARRAVQKALQTLGKVPGVDGDRNDKGERASSTESH